MTSTCAPRFMYKNKYHTAPVTSALERKHMKILGAFWSDSKNMSQKIRCPLTGRSLWVQCLQSSSKPAKDTKWDPASKINKNRVKRNWERQWVSHTGYQAPRISLSPSPLYWIYKQTLLILTFWCGFWRPHLKFLCLYTKYFTELSPNLPHEDLLCIFSYCFHIERHSFKITIQKTLSIDSQIYGTQGFVLLIYHVCIMDVCKHVWRGTQCMHEEQRTISGIHFVCDNVTVGFLLHEPG